MFTFRSTHYWLWFLLFGVVSAVVNLFQGQAISSETVWLLGGGLFGIVTGSRMLAGLLQRPYDLVAGIALTGAGLVGILHNLGINLVATNPVISGKIDNTTIFGLSLSLSYALIHTVLGLTSLNHGLATPKATSPGIVTEARAPATV